MHLRIGRQLFNGGYNIVFIYDIWLISAILSGTFSVLLFFFSISLTNEAEIGC